jgi:hypothetical protein
MVYTTLLPRLAPGFTVTSLSGKAVAKVRGRRDRSAEAEPGVTPTSRSTPEVAAPDGSIPPADGRY